ncbi:MAG TPA: beta/gamma crystallin-related protein [Usitatibacter sp.]|nr:beta/gamma crystallin-related protein [Usitatibacter sp.]
MKRFLPVAALLIATSASAQEPQGQAIVFERADFQGRSLTLRDDTGNLALMGFNDRAASLYVLDGTWELCTDAWFRGSCRIYGPGQYRNLGGQARRVSSGRLVGQSPSIGHAMRPGEGRWQDVGRGDVSVFDAREFRGFLTTLSDAVRDFERIGINDRVASIIVNRGTWQFCTHANFQGDCHVYGPGEYRSLPSGRDDAYSSARPVEPNALARRPPQGAAPAKRGRIAMFEGIDFQGRSIYLDAPMANLELLDFNDRARSIVVDGGTWRLCSDAQNQGECHDFPPGRYPAIPRGLSGKVSSALVR